MWRATTSSLWHPRSRFNMKRYPHTRTTTQIVSNIHTQLYTSSRRRGDRYLTHNHGHQQTLRHFHTTPLIISKKNFHKQHKNDMTNNSTTDNPHRLPTWVRPNKYNITLEPNLTEFTFTGTVAVEFTVQEPTDKIVVNSKELTIQSVNVDGENVATSIDFNVEQETVTFQFDKRIERDGVLNIVFAGILNDKMAGFYRSKYQKDNETRYMAVTQFEATDARRCIPCWDEPALKAVFECTLIVPTDRVALSNMNVVEERAYNESKKLVKFAPTVIMSTYLLAFAVGELEYIEEVASNGIPIRVYTQIGKTNQGKFGLQVALKVLPLLEKYYDMKYPLSKLDLIAVPDFSAGAMENFGLITYRETALLIDEENSSASARQWVALVVSHEIAHQWFGNTVTFEWWTDLWLNEGFATAVEYICVNQMFPEWNILDQFIHDDFGRAQSLDSLASSHPVEVEVKAAAEVDEVFDAISYSKGCALIYMLINYLSLDVFNKGIQQYLKKYEYKNATTNDLWNALSESSGVDNISQMMTSWTKQTGFPVLTITEEVNNDSNNKKTFKITQNRYLDSGIQYEDPSLWIIPFGYITSNNPKNPVYTMLSDRTSTITIEESSDIEWVKFNPNLTGFYRVKYPSEYYKKFVPLIKNKTLSAIDRLSIQDDVCSLARSGAISSAVALEILEAYTEEDNYTVWTSIATNLAQFWNIIKSQQDEQELISAFSSFACHLFNKQKERLGWQAAANESHLDTMLREVVIQNLTVYQDAETHQTGVEKFAEYQSNKSCVSPDLRQSMLSIALMNKDKYEENFNQILDMYKKEQLQEEQVRCLKALGSVRDVDHIEKVLQFTLSENVKNQDAFFVIGGLLNNPLATELLWKWFTANIKQLKERYDGGFLYGRFIKYCVNGFTREDQLQTVKQFFSDESNKTAGSLRSIDQAIELVELHVNWSKRAIPELKQFFAQKNN